MVQFSGSILDFNGVARDIRINDSTMDYGSLSPQISNPSSPKLEKLTHATHIQIPYSTYPSGNALHEVNAYRANIVLHLVSLGYLQG